MFRIVLVEQQSIRFFYFNESTHRIASSQGLNIGLVPRALPFLVCRGVGVQRPTPVNKDLSLRNFPQTANRAVNGEHQVSPKAPTVQRTCGR